MTFERDTAKSMQNFELHGFDFEFATLVFSSTYVEFDDVRREYGERRAVAIGTADDFALTVVFTDCVEPHGGVVRRVISARLSNRKESRRYAEIIEATRPKIAPDEGSS